MHSNNSCEEEDNEKFWNELTEVTDKIKQTEDIALADLNVHVGAEEEYGRWYGGETLGQKNDEGKMILDIVRASNLELVKTFFTKSPEQIFTNKSGQNRMVIDYITIRRDILGNLVNCKVIPGETVTLQH